MSDRINIFMKPEIGMIQKQALLLRLRIVTLMLMAVTWSVFSVFFATLADSAQAPDPVTIHVLANAQVRGKNIHLRDVAEISAPTELKETVGAICLGRAPRPGKDKKIPGDRLLSMLRAAKQMPPDAKFTVPESIQIQRAFQSIQEDVLRQLYDRSIGDALGDSDYKVRRIKVCGANRFPIGTLSFSVPKCGKRELTGNVNLRVQVQVDGENCGRLVLSGWVDRFAPVVCAIRDVKHHTVLTEADVTLKTVNVSTLSGHLVTDIADAVGKQTRTTLRAGGCLQFGMLIVPPLVQKGDRVKILAGSDKLKVSITGIAKGSGGMGDQIQVENIVSNKIIVGRVTGESTVEVMF